MSTCHKGVACIGKRAVMWHLLYIPYINSNKRHDYNYFQVRRDAATIRGWLPFEVMRRTQRAKWMKCSFSTALCMGTTSTIERGLRFWGEILSATVAAAIPGPSHRIFTLAAVVAVSLTIKCSVYLREAIYYFASLFVKWGIISRAATKRGATSIQANMVCLFFKAFPDRSQSTLITLSKYCHCMGAWLIFSCTTWLFFFFFYKTPIWSQF